MRQAAPEVVVHELTAIGHVGPPPFRAQLRRYRPAAAGGDRNLLAAAQRAPSKFDGSVAESNVPRSPTAGRRDGRNRTGPTRSAHRSARWPRRSPQFSTWRRPCSAPTGPKGWAALRPFYGPGTSMAPGCEQRRDDPQAQVPGRRRRRRGVVVRPYRRRRRATVAAVENGGSGVYNIVDDEPRPVAESLRHWQRCWAPRSQSSVRRFIGRLATGPAGVVLMTELRGASNAKAERELGWHPGHPSWRQGLVG